MAVWWDLRPPRVRPEESLGRRRGSRRLVHAHAGPRDRDAGIVTRHGVARFVDRTTIQADGETLTGRHIVIAAGARPQTLRIPGEECLTTSTQFLELEAHGLSQVRSNRATERVKLRTGRNRGQARNTVVADRPDDHRTPRGDPSAARDLATGRELAHVAIAGEPDFIWHNADRNLLYVAIGRPGLIDVIDTGSMRRVEQVATEEGAHTAAFDRTRQRLYVFLPHSCRAAVYEEARAEAPAVRPAVRQRDANEVTDGG
jgi:hypothetical protein